MEDRYQFQPQTGHFRSSSFTADRDSYVANIVMQLHADQLMEKLRSVTPPRWKSEQELYDAANWKPGMRMTPCTPTPSVTPSPTSSPYIYSMKRPDTPASLSPPPSERIQEHMEKELGMRYIKRSNSSFKSKRSRNVNRRINIRRHSMITRSRCTGNCVRDNGCVRHRQHASR